jgi:hypothetical protein
MSKLNPQNERIKRDYFRYLKGRVARARRRSTLSVRRSLASRTTRALATSRLSAESKLLASRSAWRKRIGYERAKRSASRHSR